MNISVPKNIYINYINTKEKMNISVPKKKNIYIYIYINYINTREIIISCD